MKRTSLRRTPGRTYLLGRSSSPAARRIYIVLMCYRRNLFILRYLTPGFSPYRPLKLMTSLTMYMIMTPIDPHPHSIPIVIPVFSIPVSSPLRIRIYFAHPPPVRPPARPSLPSIVYNYRRASKFALVGRTPRATGTGKLFSYTLRVLATYVYLPIA